MITVDWKGNMAFEANMPSGNTLLMDAYPESGGSQSGPTPVEALVASIAGCSAMDVVSILKKKQQEITSYRVEIEWDRGPEGVYPRPITGVRVKHIVRGANVDPAAVARAVQLSDEKYCTVMATLRQSTPIQSEWTIEEPVAS